MNFSRRPSAPAKRYVIGIDFGTLSGRAVLVETATGREVASAVHEYAHGVIETFLPGTRRRLRPDTALQHPADYLRVLSTTVPQVLHQAKARPEQVIGLGTAFTCCTILPTRADGAPLCFEKRWRRNPHAWVKLWKHHAAQPEANLINKAASRRGEPFLQVYGGKYSSEWLFSKVLETLRAAPAVYAAADRFIEAGDWIVWQLCGEEKRSLSPAGFKAMWVCPARRDHHMLPPRKQSCLPNHSSTFASQPLNLSWSYPSNDFFRALHPKLENVVTEKLATRLHPLGGQAGGLTPAMAQMTGLLPGTPIAIGNIDAHVAVPACGVTTPGKLVMIVGTSTCHLLLGQTKRRVEGICGVVKDGVVPGLWGYEAGQAGVGDLFAWFVEHSTPSYVQSEARREGVSVHELLERKAARLKPGASGLLALDWWNGNRSILVDADLNGLIVGLTLSTKPHEIYRALIEATAFGTRKIIDAFTRQGILIDEVYACGGLAQKNKLLMQIYADVTGRTIKVAASEQASALGAAMHAAVAAGAYPDIHAAARKMARVRNQHFLPHREAKQIYDRLYAAYSKLHDLLGRDSRSVMKFLKRLRAARFNFRSPTLQ